MNNLLKTTAVYLAIDALYLAVLQRDKMRNYFARLNRGSTTFRLLPGLMAWMLLGWGLEYFVLSRDETIWDAALLGLLVYGVFDMTNLATLRGWTLAFSVQDTIWGMVVMALVAYIRKRWVR